MPNLLGFLAWEASPKWCNYVTLPLCCARCQIQIINPIVIIEVVNCNNPTFYVLNNFLNLQRIVFYGLEIGNIYFQTCKISIPC
jgi:hypothetical protein